MTPAQFPRGATRSSTSLTPLNFSKIYDGRGQEKRWEERAGDGGAPADAPLAAPAIAIRRRAAHGSRA